MPRLAREDDDGGVPLQRVQAAHRRRHAQAAAAGLSRRIAHAAGADVHPLESHDRRRHARPDWLGEFLPTVDGRGHRMRRRRGCDRPDRGTCRHPKNSRSSAGGTSGPDHRRRRARNRARRLAARVHRFAAACRAYAGADRDPARRRNRAVRGGASHRRPGGANCVWDHRRRTGATRRCVQRTSPVAVPDDPGRGTRDRPRIVVVCGDLAPGVPDHSGVARGRSGHIDDDLDDRGRDCHRRPGIRPAGVDGHRRRRHPRRASRCGGGVAGSARRRGARLRSGPADWIGAAAAVDEPAVVPVRTSARCARRDGCDRAEARVGRHVGIDSSALRCRSAFRSRRT